MLDSMPVMSNGGEEPSPNAAYMQTVNVPNGSTVVVNLDIEPTFLRIGNYLGGNNHNGTYIYDNGTWINPSYTFASHPVLSGNKLTLVGGTYANGKFDICYK